MSKNIKVEKQKKKFNWRMAGYYLKSLFNNQICMEIGMTHKWYWAVLVFIVSILISAVPLTVHQATASGSSFLSSTYTYEYSDNFYLFVKDMKEQGIDVTFKDGYATYTGATPSYSNNYRIYQHKSAYEDGSNTSRIDFEVFYIPEGISFSNTISSIANTIPNTDTTSRDVSYIVFGYQAFQTALYKEGGTSSYGGVYGNYQHVTATSITSLLSTSGTQIENAETTTTNFKTTLDEIYIDNRYSVTWIQTGIILAVNVGVVALMGLVIFLMTRGKNNPNRSIKFHQCYGMAAWAALTPGLIALILGFMFTGYEIMLFVVTYGFR